MKVNIIGCGNVGTHLFKALADKIDVALINSHTFQGIDTNADITLISVSDNAISDVVNRLPHLSGIIAHTSGSTSIEYLASFTNYGVFYPLQTFSKDVALQYNKIPFFIEGSNQNVTEKLWNLASLISNNITFADSEQRKALHIASVFACNFTNHLWNIADDILKENGMHFNLLQPLLEETLHKTTRISPKDAQTGPARRNDTDVILSHLNALSKHPELQKIYQLISYSIQTTYN